MVRMGAALNKRRGVRRVIDYVNVFVVQFSYNAMNAAAFHAYASTYGIYAVIIAFYGNLCTFSGYACNALE